jgi:hypothetical protein
MTKGNRESRSIKAMPILVSMTVCLAACLIFVGKSGARSGPHAELGHGSMGRYSWGAWVTPAGSGKGRRPPCILVGLAGPSGRKNGLYHRSEGDACGRPADDAPVTQTVSIGHGRRERTVFAGAFSTRVRQIRLDLGRKGSMTLQARTLGKGRAQHASVDPLSYVVKGFAGPFCLRRIVGLDATGQMLSDSGLMSCERF